MQQSLLSQNKSSPTRANNSQNGIPEGHDRRNVFRKLGERKLRKKLPKYFLQQHSFHIPYTQNKDGSHRNVLALCRRKLEKPFWTLLPWQESPGLAYEIKLP